MTPRGRRFVKEQLPNGDGNDFDTGLHKLPGPTPLLQMNAGRCTIIVIFLRCWHLGGTVDPHPIVDEPLQKVRHIFLNPDNPLERLKHVGTELTSMGRYQQDTRARFLDATTVLHGSASGNAEELAKSLMRDLIALGLQSFVRMLEKFRPEDCHLGGVHVRAGRISGQLQADPAEAPVSRSAMAWAGRFEVQRFRRGRLHLLPVLRGRCRLLLGADFAAGPGHSCAFLSRECITMRLGKATISDVDIITPGANRLALQHAGR